VASQLGTYFRNVSWVAGYWLLPPLLTKTLHRVVGWEFLRTLRVSQRFIIHTHTHTSNTRYYVLFSCYYYNN
jgi:hypothetical protein